jgi:hypothetical protein
MLPFKLPTAIGLHQRAYIAILLTETITLYRLIRGDPHDVSNYRGHSAEWAAQKQSPEIARLAVRTYLTAAGAREQLRDRNSAVARLVVRPSPQIHVAQTNSKGHVDVWTPDVLLAAAFRATVPLDGEAGFPR